MAANFNRQFFDEFPVIGILRGVTPEQLDRIAAAAAAGGLRNLEVTMNTPGATAMITRLAETVGDRMNIGAGTVCTRDELDAAATAGACFIVTPILDVSIVRACKKLALVAVPGAFTPTEIYRAWDAGADFVKVFPATTLGPGYIKGVLGPLPQIRLVPTGGVSLNNIREYRDVGAAGFGIGGLLFNKERIAAGDWGWITDQVRALKNALQ